VISAIETAAIETDPELRQRLLTFVISGGGFSGTEVCAEVCDFAKKLVGEYPHLDPNQVRVVLVHAGQHLLDREMIPSIGEKAAALLEKRGVEICYGRKLESATPDEAILDNGERIATQTIISSAPSHPNPLIDDLMVKKVKGRVATNGFMQVEGVDGVWAIGDCAYIPCGEGFAPPTAQFAVQEAKVLAENIVSEMHGKEKKPFFYRSKGMLGALGHHTAVAQFFGKWTFSGLFAWILWRFVYWMKLPGLDRKIKTAASWILDMIIPGESIQLRTFSSQGITPQHFEAGQIIFREGDAGDYLYIITEGEVEVFTDKEHIAYLHRGEYFGEMALLNEKLRSATVRATKPTNVLALGKRDFGALITHFSELKKNFEETDKVRRTRSKRETA
jgi:NADH:ubiquinone reductase (H+-translocating)